ncbi:hypothetical protein HYX08_03930 [Candidatus Woesearchaeota archaeon]|nr:hypothetical protein [Candidatus Woesearchaeota archaeon]
MNKTASMDDILNFFRIIFAIFVFYSITLVANAAIKEKIDVFETESRLLTHSLLLSKDISHVDDEIKRQYIGTIDLEKFSSEEFKSSILNSIYYGSVNSEASAKLELEDIESGDVYTTYYNEPLYKEKKVLVEAKLIGEGAARGLSTNFYVLIKDKDNIKKGVLTVDAVLPN